MSAKMKLKFLTACFLLAISACSGGGGSNADNDSNASTTANSADTDADSSPNANANANISSGIGTLNPENANAVILQAFEIMTGRAYDQRLVNFSYILSTAGSSESPIVLRDCENDGSLTQQPINNDPSNVQLNLTNCLSQQDIYNGSLAFRLLDQHSFKANFFNGFTSTLNPNGTMNISGTYSHSEDSTFSQSFSVSDFDYLLTFNGATLLVENAFTQREWNAANILDNAETGRMTGSFTMTPPVLAGERVEVSVLEDFSTRTLAPPLQYETGRMQIVAADSQIIIDANTGDEQTLNLTLIDSNDNMSARVEQWSVWLDALAYSPPSPEKQQSIPAPLGNEIVIDVQNYRNVLTQALGVYTGETAGTEILAIPELYAVPDFPIGFLAESPPANIDDGPVVQSCDNQRFVTHTPHRQGSRQISSGWLTLFDDCDLGERNFEGWFRTSDRGNVIYSAEGFDVASPGFQRMLTGVIDYKFTADRDGSPTRHYIAAIDNYFSANNDSNMTISQATTNYSTNQTSHTLSGQYVIQSNETRNQPVAVKFVDELRSDFELGAGPDLQLRFQTGLLGIDAGAGNQLWMNANNGDNTTFDVTIYSPGATPVVLTDSWLEWQNALAFRFNLLNR